MWKTMDSAPKDDTEILAWSPDDGQFVVVWDDHKGWLWTAYDLDGDEVLYPTHWMPLPELPE